MKVKDDLVDIALGYLVDSKKVLKFEEDGSVLMAVNKYVKGLDPQPDEMPLEKAVLEWFKSPESRTFVAAQPLPAAAAEDERSPSTSPRSRSHPRRPGIRRRLEAGVARFLARQAADGNDLTGLK